MKLKSYYGCVSLKGRIVKSLGIYDATDIKKARILAQADAIRKGLNYKLVKVESIEK